jgi:hypothetical protein
MLRTEMPRPCAHALELFVGVVLVGLGVHAIRRALATKSDGANRADRIAHARRESARGSLHPRHHARPVLVGVVHGLAGSGALATLAMARLPSLGHGLTFMVLYSLGAMVGMTLLAMAAGRPIAKLAERPTGIATLLSLTGALSVGLGTFWGYLSVVELVAAV